MDRKKIAEILIATVCILCIEPHILFVQTLEEHYSSLLVKFGYIDGNDSVPIKNIWYWFLVIGGFILCGAYWWKRYSGITKKSDHRRQLTDAVSVFGMIVLISSLFGSISYDSLRPYWIIYPVDLFFAVHLFLNAKSCQKIIGYCVAACSLQAIYAVAYYFLDIHQYVTPHFGHRTQGTYDSPNSLYPVCMICIPFGVTLAYHEKSNFNKFLISISLFTCIFAELLTFSRAGWIASGLSLIFLSAIGLKHNSRISINFRALTIILSVILILSAFFIRTRGTVMGGNHDRSVLGRIVIWKNATDIVANHFWLGTGTGTFPIVQESHYSNDLVAFDARNIDAKSLFLNVAVEQGIIGLLSLFCVIFAIIRLGKSLLSVNRKSPCSYEIGILSSLFGIAIASLFDTPILQANSTAASVLCFILLGFLTFDHIDDGDMWSHQG